MNLHGNYIGDEGAKAIAEALRGNAVPSSALPIAEAPLGPMPVERRLSSVSTAAAVGASLGSSWRKPPPE